MYKFLEIVREICTPEFLGFILFGLMYESAHDLISKVLWGAITVACGTAVFIEIVVKLKGETE